MWNSRLNASSGAEVLQGLQVLEIADVLAHPGLVPLRQGERVLEVRADRDQRHGTRHRQRERQRGVPARPAEEDRCSVHHPHHRVVVARRDLAIVEQEGVGDGPEARHRLVVPGGDRLVARVAARHHQRPADQLQQQLVQRRVGGHDPDAREARRHRRREGGARDPREQHDRALARAEQSVLVRPDHAQPGGVGDGAHHDGERLRLAGLARAQAPHRGVAGRVRGQMEPAQPADRDDLARQQPASRLPERILPLRASPGAAGLCQPHTGAALGATVGLRVIPPVRRVRVLREAGSALREAAHARPRPVIRHRLDHREAWPAGRARDERETMASVPRVVELGFALRAERDVGRDRLAPIGLGLALDDREARLIGQRVRRRLDRLDLREGGRLEPQRVYEGAQRSRVALGGDRHLARLVAYPARQPVPRGQTVHERPEADPLHQPPHRDPPRLPRRGLGGCATHATDRPRAHSRRKSHQASSPSPVSADVKKKRSPGLIVRAWRTARSRSNGT